MLAGGLTVAGLAICHLCQPIVHGPGGTVFLLLGAICAALVLFTRGLGAALGAGVGAVSGLSLTIALTSVPASAAAGSGGLWPAPASQFAVVPLVNTVTFAALTTAIMGLLGYIGGCWPALPVRPDPGPDEGLSGADSPRGDACGGPIDPSLVRESLLAPPPSHAQEPT